MAAPLHRHRSSLEGIIVPGHQPLKPEDYDKANALFGDIIAQFEPSQETDDTYKPITLIRLVKEEVADKDNFLDLFFFFVKHDLHGDTGAGELNFAQILSSLDFSSWSTDEKKALGGSVTTFARYLMDNFFLPLKALAAKTPQPTPASFSRPQLSESAIGTPQRVSNLRRDCLVRDRHRCVVTRKFDIQEAEARYKRDGNDVKDDDKVSLLPERDTMTYLEVAHIIPHSLMSLTDIGGEPQLIAHKILNMFDPGTIHLISGSDIDRPMNALTLTHDLHRLFGNFEISFEYIEPHTYKIDYVRTDRMFRVESLPVTRTLYLTPDRSIDPPSSHLLKIHRAIGRILYLSGAGEYIDKWVRDLEDMEGGYVSADGSTRIDEYVSLKLRGRLAEMSVY